MPDFSFFTGYPKIFYHYIKHDDALRKRSALFLQWPLIFLVVLKLYRQPVSPLEISARICCDQALLQSCENTCRQGGPKCRPPPRCGTEKVMKKGSFHDGKPKFSCEECRSQLVGNPSNEMIPQEAWNLVGRLLLEEISAQESQEPRKHGLSNI